MTDDGEDFEVVQERDAVRSRRIVLVGLLGVVIALFAVFMAGVLVTRSAGTLHPRALGLGEVPRTAPSELSGLEQSLIDVDAPGIKLRERQRAGLARYYWVDREAGIAAIPIERAEAILIQREQRESQSRPRQP